MSIISYFKRLLFKQPQDPFIQALCRVGVRDIESHIDRVKYQNRCIHDMREYESTKQCRRCNITVTKGE